MMRIPQRLRRRSPLGLAVALAALALVAAGCSGGAGDADSGEETSSSAAASPTTATAAARPETGACYELSHADALAPTNAAEVVDCGAAHTSATYEVGTLSALVGGHLLAVDSDRVAATLTTACRTNLASYLGTDTKTVQLSVVEPVWFSPSVDESDAGADWYRCDVIAVVDDEQLGELPNPIEGAFADGAGSLGLCGTASPDAEDFRRVACGLDHTWRAVDAIDLGDTFPGTEAAEAAGDDVCPQAGADASDDPLNFQYSWEAPTQEQFDAGRTWGLCWVPA